jgi:hypothetical protein
MKHLQVKIPKVQKNTVKASVFFEVLGSAHVKAARKYVGEIDDRFLRMNVP